jgi:hypothetical protein
VPGDEVVTLRTWRRRENPWVWATLLAVLALYVFSALRVGPVSNFGIIGDDALYFSSAKALAAGQGYILPSFPVRLKATKYPELYPLLLAGVWKLDPHFPGNINVAVGLTLAFGCLALLFAFLLLRRWRGLGDWQALAIVTLCALTTYFLWLSASVMTDIPFMATMLGAVWLEEGFEGNAQTTSKGRFETHPSQRSDEGHGTSKQAVIGSAIGAGLLAGISVGFRSLGMATVAGIGLVLLVRRDYRRTFWFSLAAAPLVALFLWPAFSALVHPSNARLVTDPDASGWTQTLCYYSSYACNWRMNVEGEGMLRAVVLTNLKDIFQQPGLELLTPLVARTSLLALVLVSLVSVGAYAGILRQVRRAGWQPLPLVFLLYLLVVVPWPYPPGRFLVPFLPLFFGGLWVEGRHFVALVTEYLRQGHSAAERTISVALTLGVLLLALTVAANYALAIPAETGGFAAKNRSALVDEREAYEWIRIYAAPNSRVIAYRGGLAYLYTGHPSVPPIAWQTGSSYRNIPRYAERDAKHLADVARHVRAAYWLRTPGDFLFAGRIEHRFLQARQKQLLAGSPVVFESVDGTVRLYDVRCFSGAVKKGCGRKAWASRGSAEAPRRAPKPSPSTLGSHRVVTGPRS